MDGDVTDFNIFTSVANDTGAEAQFVFDYKCIGFDIGKTVFHADESIAEKNFFIGNYDTSGIKNLFAFFPVVTIESQALIHIVVDVIGEDHLSIANLMNTRKSEPGDTVFAFHEIGIGNEGVFKVDRQAFHFQIAAVESAQGGNPSVKNEFGIFAANGEIIDIFQQYGDGFLSFIVVGKVAVSVV